jgi:hypothetical protein
MADAENCITSLLKYETPEQYRELAERLYCDSQEEFLDAIFGILDDLEAKHFEILNEFIARVGSFTLEKLSSFSDCCITNADYVNYLGDVNKCRLMFRHLFAFDRPGRSAPTVCFDRPEYTTALYSHVSILRFIEGFTTLAQITDQDLERLYAWACDVNPALKEEDNHKHIHEQFIADANTAYTAFATNANTANGLNRTPGEVRIASRTWYHVRTSTILEMALIRANKPTTWVVGGIAMPAAEALCLIGSAVAIVSDHQERHGAMFEKPAGALTKSAAKK